MQSSTSVGLASAIQHHTPALTASTNPGSQHQVIQGVIQAQVANHTTITNPPCTHSPSNLMGVELGGGGGALDSMGFKIPSKMVTKMSNQDVNPSI